MTLRTLEGLNTSRMREINKLQEIFNITNETLASLWNYSFHYPPKGGQLLPKEDLYCGNQVKNFRLTYREFHGYLSLVVCVFGTIANILNIIVLTRKHMASPINSILTALAVADMLVMIEYVPFTCHMNIMTDRPVEEQFTYGWTVFVLFHSNFTQVFHTISIWLTVTLAVWRYLAISHPQHSQSLCTSERCRMAIVAAYVCPVILCAPSFLLISIQKKRLEEDRTLNVYMVGLSDMAKARDGLFHRVHFWMYSVVIKLLPCIVLTVLSYWLIQALYQANRRKQQLNNAGNCHSLASTSNLHERKVSKYERRTDRTTRMLVAVLLLFLVTEFPQGILALLSGIHGQSFFKNCYSSLGEILDMFALLNSAINFLLYCFMSKQFRRTFSDLFKPKVLSKWAPSTQTEVQSTYV